MIEKPYEWGFLPPGNRPGSNKLGSIKLLMTNCPECQQTTNGLILCRNHSKNALKEIK